MPHTLRRADTAYKGLFINFYILRPGNCLKTKKSFGAITFERKEISTLCVDRSMSSVVMTTKDTFTQRMQ